MAIAFSRLPVEGRIPSQAFPRSPGSRAGSIEACLGSTTTQDCSEARASAPAHVAFRLNPRRRRPDCSFSELNTQPTSSLVYASPNTSRCPAQNSGPSGSLLLTRGAFATPASCRFLPAHGFPLFPPPRLRGGNFLNSTPTKRRIAELAPGSLVCC